MKSTLSNSQSFCNLSLANDFMCTVVFFIEDYKIEDYPTDFTPKNWGLYFLIKVLPGLILKEK